MEIKTKDDIIREIDLDTLLQGRKTPSLPQQRELCACSGV